MKKIIILLLIAGLFTACNNDKGKSTQAANREKDDYNDRSKSKNDSDKKASNADDANDKGNTSGNSGSSNSGGWTKSDEATWMKECADPLKEKMGEERANTYCSCVMEKFKIKYPSYTEFNTNGTEEEGTETGKKCLREMGLGQDKNGNDANDDNKGGWNKSSNDNENTKTATGWPQNERDGFMKECKKKAIASGTSRLVAQSYCQCMMEKMESLYPDINDAGRLTPIQIERIITKYKDKCLVEH